MFMLCGTPQKEGDSVDRHMFSCFDSLVCVKYVLRLAYCGEDVEDRTFTMVLFCQVHVK